MVEVSAQAPKNCYGVLTPTDSGAALNEARAPHLSRYRGVRREGALLRLYTSLY